MGTRVSEIRVSKVDKNIAHMFASVGSGRMMPKQGVVLYLVGGGRFEAISFLGGGGRSSMILEIVNDVLKPAPN